jgi:hypothetical protein
VRKWTRPQDSSEGIGFSCLREKTQAAKIYRRHSFTTSMVCRAVAAIFQFFECLIGSYTHSATNSEFAQHSFDIHVA